MTVICMNEIVKITVVTLVYNNFHLLNKAITSIEAQILEGGTEIEYIILDDGSTYFNKEKIFDYLSTLKRKGVTCKVLVNDVNVGTVASLNKVISIMEGDLLIPLSADDEFYDQFVLSRIVNEFEVSDSNIITALRVPIKDGAEMKTLPKEEFYTLFNNSKLLLNHLVLEGNIISGASTYYRKEAFTIHGSFSDDYRLLEDFPFYISALIEGAAIGLMRTKTLKYGIDGITSNANNHPELIKDNYKLCNFIINNVKLDFFQKRKFTFNHLLNSNQRRNVKGICMYPEQFVIRLIKRMRSKKYD